MIESIRTMLARAADTGHSNQHNVSPISSGPLRAVHLSRQKWSGTSQLRSYSQLPGRHARIPRAPAGFSGQPESGVEALGAHSEPSTLNSQPFSLKPTPSTIQCVVMLVVYSVNSVYQVQAAELISQKVSIKSFCKSRFPHKFVNLSFILVIMKESRLTCV